MLFLNELELISLHTSIAIVSRQLRAHSAVALEYIYCISAEMV